MSFPWPVIEADQTLNDALDIAMRDLPAGEEECADVESFAGQAIIDTIGGEG